MSSSEHERRRVERARAGDRDAFDELLRPIRDDLLRRIERKIGSALRESLEPEDVLQEAQLRALGAIDRFRWQGEGSFRAWLEGIATHFILSSARTSARRSEYRMSGEPGAPYVSPSRHERREERFERLSRSVESLPEDYRTAIRLARIEGLAIAEVATRMGRTPAAVKNLLYKAMRKLRDSFGDTESLSLPDRRLGDEEANDGR